MSTFSRKKVCAIIQGVTYRQLCYWQKTNLISASVDTTEFSWDDLLEIKLIASLLQAGVSLKSIRKGLEINKALANMKFSTATLVTDGKSLFRVENNSKEIIDLLHSGQMVMGIFIPRILEQLNAQAELYALEFPKHWARALGGN